MYSRQSQPGTPDGVLYGMQQLHIYTSQQLLPKDPAIKVQVMGWVAVKNKGHVFVKYLVATCRMVGHKDS